MPAKNRPREDRSAAFASTTTCPIQAPDRTQVPCRGEGRRAILVIVGVSRFHFVLRFAKQLLGDAPVSVLYASKDSELSEYLKAVRALASQATTSEGIFIQLDDTDPGRQPELWGAFLEELAHAIQNQRRGAIPLSIDDDERRKREFEVADCMFRNATRLALCGQDREHYASAMKHYGSGDPDAG